MWQQVGTTKRGHKGLVNRAVRYHEVTVDGGSRVTKLQEVGREQNLNPKGHEP